MTVSSLMNVATEHCGEFNIRNLTGQDVMSACPQKKNMAPVKPGMLTDCEYQLSGSSDALIGIIDRFMQ